MGANCYLANLLRVTTMIADMKELRMLLLVRSRAEMKRLGIGDLRGLESVRSLRMQRGKFWRMGLVTLAAKLGWPQESTLTSIAVL